MRRRRFLEQLRRDRLAGELPDDGAQEGALVEAQPVIHGPQEPVVSLETVAGLTIPVPGDHVERREPAELVLPALLERVQVACNHLSRVNLRSRDNAICQHQHGAEEKTVRTK